MWGCVAVDSRERPTMVRIHLKRSKCNQFGAGAHIIVGRTGSPLCPVTVVLEYIEIQGSAACPFFQGSDSQPVLKAWFVEQLRSILAAAGLPQQQYAGHRFRIGAATTAALAGVEDSMIQTLGRWHSGAFLQYIRTPSETLANLSSVLARRASQNTQPWVRFTYHYLPWGFGPLPAAMPSSQQHLGSPSLSPPKSGHARLTAGRKPAQTAKSVARKGITGRIVVNYLFVTHKRTAVL